jgi:hypothetical protein
LQKRRGEKPRLKGRANDPLASPVGPTRLCRGGDFGLPEGPPSHGGQAQSLRVGLVRSMEPATRLPAPGPLSGAGSAPLPAQAKGSSVQGPVVLPTASTGEQAAFSGRQLSYAEVVAAYAGVVAGRPVKGATAGVDSSAPLSTKKGPHRRVTEGGTRRRPAELPLCPSPPEGRRMSWWAPLLADAWAITPPHQKSQVGR